MNHLLCTLCLLLAMQVAYTQSLRVDSLTHLIENSTSDNEKARLLLLRSRIAPPTWTMPQAMDDAQRSLGDLEKARVLLVAQGLSSKQIARNLFISIETVKTHRRRMLSKNNINSFPHLIYLLQNT